MDANTRPDHSSTSQVEGPESEAEVCQACFNTGMEVIRGRGARPCRCRTISRRGHLFDNAGIPQRYLSCSLQNYQIEPGNITQQCAVHYALRLISDYPMVDRGLLLAGPVGTGKTHIAVAILRGLLEKGVPCKFYEVGALLTEIQNSYSPLSRMSEIEILQPVFRTEVVVLDELGAKKPSEWVLDTMMEVVNARYNDMRLTIFTTNFLDGVATAAQATLDERIGVKVRSRLYEMCHTVEIRARDFRKLDHRV